MYIFVLKKKKDIYILFLLKKKIIIEKLISISFDSGCKFKRLVLLCFRTVSSPCAPAAAASPQPPPDSNPTTLPPPLESQTAAQAEGRWKRKV